jgi:serine/threonine protein kinase
LITLGRLALITMFEGLKSRCTAGQVKVLDFGLARQFAPTASGASAPSGPHTITLTSETTVGTVPGTPSYMSPEQAREAPLTPRSDLFSLGAVFYQCLRGRPAFCGVNPVEMLAARW